MASSVACECGAEEQTVGHVVLQCIDLPTDCTAWRLWTVRQSNGCSTPAPRSSAAKQWFEQLAQKKYGELKKYGEYVTEN